ncbi:unnamed protein product [Prunus brigantina]
MGKSHREAFNKEKVLRASMPLELIHLDVCGPMQYTTIGEEAVNTAVYIQNRCPTRALNDSSPFEAFSGRKLGIKHLRVFGSICYCYVPGQLRLKLDDSATKCIFVGYGKCEKGYRVYNLQTHKIVVSRSVIFDEDALWDWGKQDMEHVYVPISFEENPRTTEEEDEVTGSPTTVSQIESGSGLTSASSQSAAPSSTLVKLRDMAEIYARCNMSITEP